jgi:hypothetical protein
MSKVLQNKKSTPSQAKTKTSTANPTLDTIKMVEQALSKMSEYTSKNRLWRALPRQVQYPTFKAILDYLDICGQSKTKEANANLKIIIVV